MVTELATCQKVTSLEISKLPAELWSTAYNQAIATSPPKGVTASHIASVVKKINESRQGNSLEKPAATASQVTQEETKEPEQSFFKCGDLVWIDCPQSAQKEYTCWNNYWGTVTHLGRSGSIEVTLAGKKIRFMKHDLNPIDNPAPILKDIAQRINDLYNSPDVDEFDKHTLEQYLKRLAFNDIQLDRLEQIWNYYSNRKLIKPSEDDE